MCNISRTVMRTDYKTVRESHNSAFFVAKKRETECASDIKTEIE